MIRIAQHEVVVDPSRLAALQAEFAERHCLLFRQAVEPTLLVRLAQMLEATPFHERLPGVKRGRIIARELCAEPESLVMRAFSMLFSRPALFRAIEQLTLCPPVGAFQGRVYMMQPDAGHYDTWHSDCDGNRLIGLSLNLSREYSGGEFRIRERDSERVVAEIHNVVPGDVHVFRIAPNLQHCVEPVTGAVTKVAYAGWFQSRGRKDAAT